MTSVWMGNIVVYGSRVVLFFFLLRRRRALWNGRVFSFLILTAILRTFIRVRRIEPNEIAIEHVKIDAGIGKKVVLLADIHVGQFKSFAYLQRVVNTINTLTGVDIVFIAGDFTYNPTSGSLLELYQPLADLHVPIYAVLGNHDVEHPGPKVRNELILALDHRGVNFLNNDIVDMGGRYLVGLGDHDGGEDNVFLLDQFDPADDVVVLTHNPDTILNYTKYTADVTLVGHTHCGQIRLPWIHQQLAPFIIPVEGPFDCGLVQNKYTMLYITPGVGEVILPMRRFNPPTISIIDL